MGFLKSRAVGDLLGIQYYTLFELIRSGRLSPPPKDSSGDYIWTAADVDRARQALQSRRRKQEPAVEALHAS